MSYFAPSTANSLKCNQLHNELPSKVFLRINPCIQAVIFDLIKHPLKSSFEKIPLPLPTIIYTG